MPSWGANTTDESKPKWLTEEQKSRTFATTRGWEIIGDNGIAEVLVAINNLSGGSAASSKLATATISAVYFLSTSYVTGATGRVRVVWNEKITPTTTGTLIVKQTNATSNAVTNITATRAGNTTSNFIEYTFAVGNTTAYTYTIGAQTITQGVNDFGTTTVTSQLVIVTSAVVRARALATGSTGVTTTAS
jgi:hypothetical protein